MIQQCSAGMRGAPSDMEIQLRETLALTDRMTKILAHHTGQPYDRVKKDIDRDFFMTAEEAKEYGIIDAVIEPRRGLGFAPLAAAAAAVSLAAWRSRMRFRTPFKGREGT